jgi:hypothetical protein
MLYNIHLNVSVFILKYNKTVLLLVSFVKFNYLQMITEKHLMRTTVTKLTAVNGGKNWLTSNQSDWNKHCFCIGGFLCPLSEWMRSFHDQLRQRPFYLFMLLRCNSISRVSLIIWSHISGLCGEDGGDLELDNVAQLCVWPRLICLDAPDGCGTGSP